MTTAADRRPTVGARLDERGNPVDERTRPHGDTLRYLDECRLDRLNYAGQITDAQWRAGCLFRAKWLIAHHHGSFAIRYGERVQGGGGGVESDRRLDAADEAAKALQGMPPLVSAAVQAVCGEDESAKGWMRQLIEGLDHLREHFGVPRDFCRRPGT